MKVFALSLVPIVSLSGALLAQQNTPPQQPTARENTASPPHVRAEDSEKAMHEAVGKAHASMKQFMAAVSAPKSGQSGFAVKKRCIEGNKCEHVWIREVHFDGKVLRGKVDNHPVELTKVHLGQEVTIKPDEISDWMYVENGRLVGGHTVRAYYRSLSPAKQREFAKNVGFRGLE